ncbi:hypothetical protein ANANG_G00050970 [Anguilla anguilla]|uniref:Uncharacterized protein n=1 Tax=Anguilla anguilla TaxID=7936 RepID=A0A9D3S5F7_ANGAN|nr:hypothetical protein ANANG_G00050970 [Anguilla anguilla]
MLGTHRFSPRADSDAYCQDGRPMMLSLIIESPDPAEPAPARFRRRPSVRLKSHMEIIASGTAASLPPLRGGVRSFRNEPIMAPSLRGLEKARATTPI